MALKTNKAVELAIIQMLQDGPFFQLALLIYGCA
jgi:hypothetical protein